jgi:hypothetical protein
MKCTCPIWTNPTRSDFWRTSCGTELECNCKPIGAAYIVHNVKPQPQSKVLRQISSLRTRGTEQSSKVQVVRIEYQNQNSQSDWCDLIELNLATYLDSMWFWIDKIDD